MRIFTAIFPNEEVSDSLRGLRQEILGRNSPSHSDDFHITLHFLGELNGEKAQKAADAISGLEWRKFEIEIRGISTFHETGLVFASVGRGGDELNALRAAEAVRLSENGIVVKEERAYLPHITIARKNTMNLSLWKTASLGTFTAESLSLISSVQHAGRYVHTELLKVHFR